MFPRQASGDASGQPLMLLRARRAECSVLLIHRNNREGKTSTTPEGHRYTSGSTMEGAREPTANVLPEYLDDVLLKHDGIESGTISRSQAAATRF